MPTPSERKTPRTYAPIPQERLPLGSLVMVSMPGFAWWGFIGELVDHYPEADSARVRVLTENATDVPPVAMVPASWVRRLSDVFDLLDDPDSGG